MRETGRETETEIHTTACQEQKQEGGVHIITDCSLEERRQKADGRGVTGMVGQKNRYILVLFWRRTERVLRLSDAS